VVKEEDTGLIHRRDIDQIVEIPPPYDDEENDSKDKIGKKASEFRSLIRNPRRRKRKRSEELSRRNRQPTKPRLWQIVEPDRKGNASSKARIAIVTVS